MDSCRVRDVLKLNKKDGRMDGWMGLDWMSVSVSACANNILFFLSRSARDTEEDKHEEITEEGKLIIN